MTGAFRGIPYQERLFMAFKMGGPDDCWECNAPSAKKHYGRLRKDGSLVKMHHAMWEHAHGPVPDRLHVLHSCDNRACVNPAHLFLGTHTDNMQDCEAKGRRPHPVGEENPAAKLTARKVKAIRRLLASGATCALLAREYGVTDVLVGHIKRRRIWAHV
jgi:hypothetical protein